MIGFLDVACDDCKAKVGEPCKRAMYPHAARKRARDLAREEEIKNAVH